MKEKLNLLRYSLKKFFSLSLEEKSLFVRAVIISAFIRFCILNIKFDKFNKFFGTIGNESSFDDLSSNEYEYIMRVKKIVHIVCRNTIWESKCLVRAATIKYLLRKKYIKSTLYMGLNKKTFKSELLAHAWLRCGDIYLSGDEERENFIVIAKYS